MVENEDSNIYNRMGSIGKILGTISELSTQSLQQVSALELGTTEDLEDILVSQIYPEYLPKAIASYQEVVARLKIFLTKRKLTSMHKWSSRTLTCLDRARIFTVGDLTSRSEREIRNMRGIGKKSLQEIKNFMSDHGLQLAGKR